MKHDDERYAGDFKILNSFAIGNKEIVIGEDMNASDGNFYYVADYRSNEIFGEYYNALVSPDYVEIAKIYSERISEAITVLEKEKFNLNHNIITANKCDPIDNETFVGKIIVIKPTSLCPEYRNECYQIVRCTGGNGAKADGLGTSVFCKDFFSSEDVKFRRASVLGILKEEHYPEWLKNKLALENSDKGKVKKKSHKEVER
jgi:hypothetical protein